ncbi:hypothetical protein KCU67_g125, partial [Aureobasidium melanogenum]
LIRVPWYLLSISRKRCFSNPPASASALGKYLYFSPVYMWLRFSMHRHEHAYDSMTALSSLLTRDLGFVIL